MGRKALYATIAAYFLILGVTLSAIAAGYDHIPRVENHGMQFKYLGF